MSVLSQFAPAAVDWIGRNFMAPREKRNAAPRRPHGNLFQPSGNGRVQGDHPGYVHKSSLYTRAALHPMLTGTLMIAAGAAAAALLAGSRSETGKRRR